MKSWRLVSRFVQHSAAIFPFIQSRCLEMVSIENAASVSFSQTMQKKKNTLSIKLSPSMRLKFTVASVVCVVQSSSA